MEGDAEAMAVEAPPASVGQAAFGLGEAVEDAACLLEYDAYLQERIQLEYECQYYEALSPLLQRSHTPQPAGTRWGHPASAPPPPAPLLENSPSRRNMFAARPLPASKRAASGEQAAAKRQRGAERLNEGVAMMEA